MNLHCVIPEANFNDEKQMLLVAYCAPVGRPISNVLRALKTNLPAREFSKLLCCLFSKDRHGIN